MPAVTPATPAARGPAGAIGPPGPKGDIGPAGSAGPTGPRGISGYQVVQNSFSVDAGGVIGLGVDCPAGKHVLGGGAELTPSVGLVLDDSFPTRLSGGRDNWLVHVHNAGKVAENVVVYAVCASTQ